MTRDEVLRAAIAAALTTVLLTAIGLAIARG